MHIDDDFDDGIELTRFFGILRHYNREQDIDEHHRKKIVEYFDYKWRNDKNIAIDLDSDRILSELPVKVQRFLYINFLNY